MTKGTTLRRAIDRILDQDPRDFGVVGNYRIWKVNENDMPPSDSKPFLLTLKNSRWQSDHFDTYATYGEAKAAAERWTAEGYGKRAM